MNSSIDNISLFTYIIFMSFMCLIYISTNKITWRIDFDDSLEIFTARYIIGFNIGALLMSILFLLYIIGINTMFNVIAITFIIINSVFLFLYWYIVKYRYGNYFKHIVNIAIFKLSILLGFTITFLIVLGAELITLNI